MTPPKIFFGPEIMLKAIHVPIIRGEK